MVELGESNVAIVDPNPSEKPFKPSFYEWLKENGRQVVEHVVCNTVAQTLIELQDREILYIQEVSFSGFNKDTNLDVSGRIWLNTANISLLEINLRKQVGATDDGRGNISVVKPYPYLFKTNSSAKIAGQSFSSNLTGTFSLTGFIVDKSLVEQFFKQ